MQTRFSSYLWASLLISLFFFQSPSLAQQRIYNYEPVVTVLDGVLQTRVYPGPPNYENIRTGDTPETIWLVKLKEPISLPDDGNSTSNNEPETNVREIQLILPATRDEKVLKKAIGKTVRLTGTLLHALTGHHHLKILMDVRSYQIK